MSKGLATLLTHIGCLSGGDVSVIQKSGHLLEHVPNRQTPEGFLLSERNVTVRSRRGVRRGLPTVTVVDSRPITLALVFPKAAALCERLRALSVLAQIRLLGRCALGVLLQGAATVQPVLLVFSACAGCLNHVACILPP